MNIYWEKEHARDLQFGMYTFSVYHFHKFEIAIFNIFGQWPLYVQNWTKAVIHVIWNL